MKTNGRTQKYWDLGSYTLAIGILLALFLLSLKSFQSSFDWQAVWAYREKFVQGWLATIGISLASLFLSAVIGLAVVALAKSPVGVLRALARVYVEVIRGTPLLVQILVFFYVVAHAVGLENRYVVGVISLSLFSGAYMSEIFRAGLESLPKSQIDTARALGLNRGQTLRYVIFPQALRVVLPPLAGQLASLIKDSSLLSIIAISEFTLNAQEVNSFTYSTLESYLPLAIGYLVLTLPISLGIRGLEKWVSFET